MSSSRLKSLRGQPVWGAALLAGTLIGACATKAPRPPVQTQMAPLPAEVTPLRERGAETLEPLLQKLAKVESAIATSPDDQAAWIQAAQLYQQAHRTQEAARAAWRAVEIEPSFASWTSLGNALVQGDVLMSMGGAMGAFQAYSMAARQAGDPVLAARNFLHLAYRDFGLGHDQQALELIAEAEKISANEPLVFFYRACVLASGEQSDAAAAQAKKALELLDRLAPGQTPTDPAWAHMRPLAEAIIRKQPVERPGILDSGEMLPERFWDKPPTRGSALSLAVDEASDRFFPLVPGVAMRLHVPTRWAHQQKNTDKAIHLRLATAASEKSGYAEITLFPTIKDNFNLKQAADAGRRAALEAGVKVGALMPVERKQGLGFWFESQDEKVNIAELKPGAYARMWQGFVYAQPFVMSLTWFGQRADERVQDALVGVLKSFEVFRMQQAGTSE